MIAATRCRGGTSRHANELTLPLPPRRAEPASSRSPARDSNEPTSRSTSATSARDQRGVTRDRTCSRAASIAWPAIAAVAVGRSRSWPPTSPCGKCRWSSAATRDESDLTPLARDEFDAARRQREPPLGRPGRGNQPGRHGDPRPELVVVAGAGRAAACCWSEMAVLAWPSFRPQRGRCRTVASEPPHDPHARLAAGHRQRRRRSTRSTCRWLRRGRRTARSGCFSVAAALVAAVARLLPALPAEGAASARGSRWASSAASCWRCSSSRWPIRCCS